MWVESLLWALSFTFFKASIFCWSRRLSRIHRLLRLVWYSFSAGTHDLGRRSGGMVMPYSQPKHRCICKHDLWSIWYVVMIGLACVYGPWSSTALLRSSLHSTSSHTQPGGQSTSSFGNAFSPFWRHMHTHCHLNLSLFASPCHHCGKSKRFHLNIVTESFVIALYINARSY